MELALPIIIATLGLVAGSVVVQQVLRWIALLSVAISKQGGDFLGPPRRRLLWLVPLVVFLHPGLYLIGALVVITGCCLLNRLSGEWSWFLGGLYIYPIMSGLAAASMYRRFRRKSRKV
jgi:hypothetical protein